MNEKPLKLDMGFPEALARLVRVPRTTDTVVETTKPPVKHKKAGKSADKPAKKPGQQA